MTRPKQKVVKAVEAYALISPIGDIWLSAISTDWQAIHARFHWPTRQVEQWTIEPVTIIPGHGKRNKRKRK